MTADTRQLVLGYFHSWQEPSDHEAFRSALADDVVFDTGQAQMTGADALADHVRMTESPWRDVTLLASMVASDEATLFYEGVDRKTGVRTRVAEHISVRAGRITRILAVICPTETG